MPLDRSIGNYFDNTNAHLVRVMRWTGPASYVAGGEDVSPSVFGLGKVISVQHGNATDGTSIRTLAYNPSTGKLQWFVGTTGVEVAAATNLSTFLASVVVFGN